MIIPICTTNKQKVGGLLVAWAVWWHYITNQNQNQNQNGQSMEKYHQKTFVFFSSARIRCSDPEEKCARAEFRHEFLLGESRDYPGKLSPGKLIRLRPKGGFRFPRTPIWDGKLGRNPDTIRFIIMLIFIKVRLGISRTNADSQWNPVYNACHRIFCSGNKTIRR